MTIEMNRLRGCGTALVTPFLADESLDLEALTRLIEYQLDGGIDFLVACGTTGESVTLTDVEQAEVISTTLRVAAGRVPVVAGAGGYNTREVIRKIERYASLGADAILSVTPYYNKPTQEGLYQHFRALAQASPLPIILYNVPGRTGCNLAPATVARLAEFDQIVAIKEASGNIAQIAELASILDPTFRIFSGDDALILPIAALGGVGVISVASNLLPREVSTLTRFSVEGHLVEARQLYRRLLPIFQAMFVESNPIPIKAALALVGLVRESYRLPLVPLQESNRAQLLAVLHRAGLLAPFTSVAA
jgi:4-hydroxy-tetrahydrodipicolinate synthase